MQIVEKEGYTYKPQLHIYREKMKRNDKNKAEAVRDKSDQNKYCVRKNNSVCKTKSKNRSEDVKAVTVYEPSAENSTHKAGITGDRMTG